MEHMTSQISQLVWLYVKRRPFLKEILRSKIVNYSALARKISKEAFGSKKHQNAVKMALVRLSKRMYEREEDLEGKILDVLRKSSLSIRNKVAVVIASREIEGLRYLSYAESRGIVTYVIEENELGKIERTKSILSTEMNLNLVSIHSPVELEETPGVIAHILDALASEGINIAEFLSCYTDTLLVIKQADTEKVYKILSGMMD
jgi:hypothetical protein